MREILFKAKRTDNGEWVEGNLVNFGGVYWIYTGKINKLDPYTNGYGSTIYSPISYMVNHKTLCQYTGLNDKNGRKIFEGDIVRYQFDNDDCPFPNKHTEKIIGRIFFSEFRASFSVTAGKHCSTRMNNDLFKYVQNGNRVELVGNIFDNPDYWKKVQNEQSSIER